MWSRMCVVLSELCVSGEVWWQVLWCWWLPMGCGNLVVVSGVCAVHCVWLYLRRVCVCVVNGVCGCLLVVWLCLEWCWLRFVWRCLGCEVVVLLHVFCCVWCVSGLRMGAVASVWVRASGCVNFFVL